MIGVLQIFGAAEMIVMPMREDQIFHLRIIIGGYKKLGLDPAQMKYIVLTHGHDDHFGGAKYLVDTYHPHVRDERDGLGYGGQDAAAREFFGPPPARDMDLTDGQKLTLGETTLTFYLTPGHTPGTISFLVPVTDHGKPHLLSFWGGARFRGLGAGRRTGSHGFGAADLQAIARTLHEDW